MTIFVTIEDSVTARNIFSTPFWESFLANNRRERIVVLTLPGNKERYTRMFGTSAGNVTVEALNPQFHSRFAGLVTSLQRSAINSHTNLWSKMRAYERGQTGFMVTFLKRFLTWILGGFPPYKRFLRYLLLKAKPSRRVREIFNKYKPDLLLASYIANFNFDVPLVCEAQRRGIKTVGITRGWDTLSSHGLLRVVPDKLVVQSGFLKKMALTYQGVKEEKITVMGSPFYDVMFKNLPSLLEAREKFFAKLGLDPQKKFILYGAMGDFLFPCEGWIADVLEELITKGAIAYPAQAIFRPHPKFESPVERLGNFKHIRPDRDLKHFENNHERTDTELADTGHLLNLIYHSDVVVTGASTIALDAAVFGKPVICVGFDPGGCRPKYWHSVRRFYDHYTHFEAFMETGAARLARTPEELAKHINAYLPNPALDEEKRKEAVRLFAEPLDGKASERLEKILSEEIRA